MCQSADHDKLKNYQKKKKCIPSIEDLLCKT